LHISELADHKVDNPEEIVKVGQRVEVRIIKIDAEERKIGLTLIQAHFDTEDEGGALPAEAAPERPATSPLGSLAQQLRDIGQRVSEREKKATDDGEPAQG
jgi:small subunit ribosomal protein S1